MHEAKLQTNLTNLTSLSGISSRELLNQEVEKTPFLHGRLNQFRIWIKLNQISVSPNPDCKPVYITHLWMWV